MRTDLFDGGLSRVKPILKIVGIWIILMMVDGDRATAQPERFSSYVGPNIGTAHSRWFFHTPAANPFGMAKPSATMAILRESIR